jgi:DNA-binding MarR family transcriptional regulator
MTSRADAIHAAIATLQRLSDLFSARREQIARDAGLSIPQWRVLEEIATEHFMPSLFAQRRAVTPAAVSKVVRALLERDLIRSAIAEGDRRQRAFELTPVGQQLLDRIRMTRQIAIDEIWVHLPVSALNEFARFGELLGDRLDAVLDR